MEMEEVEGERFTDDIGRYTVVRQALRLRTFHMGSDRYDASNGWMIGSIETPELCEDQKELFVLGSHGDGCDGEINIPDDLIDEVMDAVDEYNRHMKKILDPTPVRLAHAKQRIVSRNRRTARSDGYRLVRIRDLIAAMPGELKYAMGLVSEMIRSMLLSIHPVGLKDCAT